MTISITLDRNDQMSLLAAGVVAAVILAAPDSMLASSLVCPVFMIAVSARIVLTDIRTFTIPDGLVVSLAIVALACRISEALALNQPVVAAAGYATAEGVLCGGMLLLVRESYYRLRGFDGLGLGDVKLAAAAGILVGILGFAWALLAASILGLVVSLPLVLFNGNRHVRIPFGALLAPACCAVWISIR